MCCGRGAVSLLARAAEQDLAAGHLAVSAQLAGPLLPNGHGHSLSPLPPGHERVRGVERWQWASLPDAALGLVQGAGVGGAAAVDRSLPVEVRPPPTTSPEKRQTRRRRASGK